MFTKANQLRPVSNSTHRFYKVAFNIITPSTLGPPRGLLSARTFFCNITLCVSTKDAWYAHWSRLQHVASGDKPMSLRQSNVVKTEVTLRLTDCTALSWYNTKNCTLFYSYISPHVAATCFGDSPSSGTLQPNSTKLSAIQYSLWRYANECTDCVAVYII